MASGNWEKHRALRALSTATLAAQLLVFTTAAPAAEYPPTDHGGADLTLANGDVIWGTHSNVGTFTIPAAATVTVKAYDGSNRIDDWKTETGTFILIAQHVQIDGQLDATGAGFTGGGGGGGACGSAGGHIPGEGGIARYGTGIDDVALVAEPGARSVCIVSHWINGCWPGFGGFGSHGDGPDGGNVSGLGITDWAAASGGYASGRGGGLNDDQSEDETLLMGSGGSGGRGGSASLVGFSQVSAGGYGGAAGGSGGGLISLTGTHSLALGDAARVTANGAMGLPKTPLPISGNGTDGRDAIESSPTTSGSVNSSDWNVTGGAGSGGGILLKCESPDGLSLSPSAVVKTLGGGELVQNGGTVKLFYTPSEHMTTLPTIYAGHRLIRTIPGEETVGNSSAKNWAEYD